MDEDRIIFLEVMLDDDKVQELIKLKAKTSPEYKDYLEADAEADFRQRIEEYKKVYESTSDDFNYIKIINNERHELNGIRGGNPCPLCMHVCHMSIRFWIVWCFTRHAHRWLP